jgi:hypothetical protein
VQGLEAGAVGLQCPGESVLSAQEVDEEADPLRQRGVRCAAAGQQGRPGLGAGVDLVPVDGDDEVGPGREVTVDRAHPDAGLGRDVAYRRVHAGGDEDVGGGSEQGLLVTPGVGPLMRGRLPGRPVDVGHRVTPSIARIDKRNSAPYVERSGVPLSMMPERPRWR